MRNNGTGKQCIEAEQERIKSWWNEQGSRWAPYPRKTLLPAGYPSPFTYSSGKQAGNQKTLKSGTMLPPKRRESWHPLATNKKGAVMRCESILSTAPFLLWTLSEHKPTAQWELSVRCKGWWKPRMLSSCLLRNLRDQIRRMQMNFRFRCKGVVRNNMSHGVYWGNTVPKKPPLFFFALLSLRLFFLTEFFWTMVYNLL